MHGEEMEQFCDEAKAFIDLSLYMPQSHPPESVGSWIVSETQSLSNTGEYIHPLRQHVYREAYHYALQKGVFEVAYALSPYIIHHPQLTGAEIEKSVQSIVEERLPSPNDPLTEEDAVALSYVLGTRNMAVSPLVTLQQSADNYPYLQKTAGAVRDYASLKELLRHKEDELFTTITTLDAMDVEELAQADQTIEAARHQVERLYALNTRLSHLLPTAFPSSSIAPETFGYACIMNICETGWQEAWAEEVDDVILYLKYILRST